MFANDSKTCPTLEGSTAAVNLLERFGDDGTEDWAKNLLAATKPVCPENPTLLDSPNELNTPTMEMAQWSFGQGTPTILASIPEPPIITGDTELAAIPTSMDEIAEEDFLNAWGNLGSPADDLLNGVSPFEVEGMALDNCSSTTMYTTTADSGGCVQEIAMDQSEYVGQTTFVSAPLVQTDLPTAVPQWADSDIENAVFVMNPVPEMLPNPVPETVSNTAPEMAPAKEEVGNEDLLKWIVEDTFDRNSAIPGEEVKQEDEIPTTVNQIELNQLFSSYPAVDNRAYLAEPSTFGPIRPAAESRRRSRNLSVASTSSSVDAPRRGRGRPPRPPGRAITPAVVRGRIVSGGEESDHSFVSDGNLTDKEITDLRYRRMRDLNNEASKRCRENRKKKYELLEQEAEELKLKNLQLKAKLQRIETAVMKAKNYYITHIVPGAGTNMPDISQLWATAV